MSLGTVLLVRIFPALLPPENPDDRDFYSVLGVAKNVSEQEIRKAYKKKSLALHPDKIAQRRENAITAEEAAREYQLVQEAHTCLANKASRQKYHAVKCSPTRFRFLTQGGGMMNHMGLLENLSNASFADKTKLVLFVSTFPALMLLQPILIAVKVNHLLDLDGALEDASWVALLVPWWIFHGLFVAFWILVTCLAPPGSRLAIAATAVEQLLWFLAILLVTLRWDQTITADYAAIFVPAYLALVIKWMHFVVTLKAITLDMSKMVSKNYFVDVVLHGREPEELEEEELKELHDKYVVVSQIPLEVEASLEKEEAPAEGEDGEGHKLSDQEKEDIRVASSREFEHALEAYSKTRRVMIKSIILDIVFVILLVLKVDEHKDFSWWIVFIPIWVSYGLRLLYNCFVCCCSVGPMSADEVLIISKAKEAMDTAGENKDGNADNDNNNAEANEESKDDKKASAKGGQSDAKSDATVAVEKKDAASGESKTESGAMSLDKSDKGKAVKSSDDNANPKDASDAMEHGEHSSSGNKKETAGDDDDEFSIHMDEEAYRAYRSAYAEAEADAMENRVRAGQTTCFACIQFVLVLLLVIKLEKASDAEEKRDEQGDGADVDVGYNALWLLFPLFLIVGFMISCCACLIYGAPSPEDLMQHKDDDGEAGNEDGDEEAGNQAGQESSNGAADTDSTPVVLAPPPPEPVAATTEAKEEGSQPTETDSEKKDTKVASEQPAPTPPPKKEESEDMNELD